ncbi:hypothetical protein Arub01_54570 [Actinomadura rubrobrunea]|uniref:Uncharacterized protein n=1 Tax=Actinomadura rubrobrunea TaxID=115335 RepID=A0A9W6PZH1_9ACTN|nr:hypothetical protein [Actinomadura rubrobrunea]GLW67214.1 hypothetical protein Arub01_54570 [Actinomadura rubrobrunea]
MQCGHSALLPPCVPARLIADAAVIGQRWSRPSERRPRIPAWATSPGGEGAGLSAVRQAGFAAWRTADVMAVVRLLVRPHDVLAVPLVRTWRTLMPEHVPALVTPRGRDGHA